MKLVSVIPADIPPVDRTIRNGAPGRLIGAPAGDLPPVEIAMDIPTAKFISLPGIPGPPGPGATQARETPTGDIDGTNTTFTLTHPFRTGSTIVYLNGLLEFFTTEHPPNQIQFSEPPQPGDTILVTYTL